MIEDATVWAGWFAAWQWWNFVMVGGGLAGLAWSTSPLWIHLFQPATKKADEKDRIFKNIFYPILWIIRKHKQLENWADTEQEQALRDLKFWIFMLVSLILMFIGLFLFAVILVGLATILILILAQFLCVFDQSCVGYLMDNWWQQLSG